MLRISDSELFAVSSFAVLPVKSDSDAMLCLQSYRDLKSIDHLSINTIHRIGLIHLTLVQVKCLLSSCKHNHTSPPLLVGMTVDEMSISKIL